MRPISNLLFGPGVGRIQVRFHNGTTVVDGYIVKQLGLKTFIVSVDGSTTYKCTLAQTTAEASTLTPGRCTILLTPYGTTDTAYVSNIASQRAVTTAGTTYFWNVGDSLPGSGAAGLSAISEMPTLPAGFAYMVDSDNFYLVDGDGAFLYGAV